MTKYFFLASKQSNLSNDKYSIFAVFVFVCSANTVKILMPLDWMIDAVLHVRLHHAIYIILFIKVLSQHQFNLATTRHKRDYAIGISLYQLIPMCQHIVGINTKLLVSSIREKMFSWNMVLTLFTTLFISCMQSTIGRSIFFLFVKNRNHIPVFKCAFSKQ